MRSIGFFCYGFGGLLWMELISHCAIYTGQVGNSETVQPEDQEDDDDDDDDDEE